VRCIDFTHEEFTPASPGGEPPVPPGWPALAPGASDLRAAWLAQERRFAGHGRARHFVALDGSRSVAGLSAFLDERLAPRGEVATFGLPFVAGQECLPALEELVGLAESWGAGLGAGFLRGPISYSTWYPNRFPSAESGPERFPGEPPYPVWMREPFLARGFEAEQTYFSVLSEPVEKFVSRIEGAACYVRSKGVTFDSFTGPDIPAVFREVHPFCQRAFANNFSFTPIDAEEFEAIFAPAARLPDARVITARDAAGALVGLVFGYAAPGFPRPSSPGEAGGNCRIAVLKSIATDPGRTDLLAGPALSYEFHKACAGLGYARVVHALMGQQHYAIGRSSPSVIPLREYVILRKPLAGAGEGAR
jgi:hypothetical protein